MAGKHGLLNPFLLISCTVFLVELKFMTNLIPLINAIRFLKSYKTVAACVNVCVACCKLCCPQSCSNYCFLEESCSTIRVKHKKDQLMWNIETAPKEEPRKPSAEKALLYCTNKQWQPTSLQGDQLGSVSFSWSHDNSGKIDRVLIPILTLN